MPKTLQRPHRRSDRAHRAPQPRQRAGAISTASTHAASKAPTRKTLGCANFAHGFAACGPGDKAGAARRRRAQSRRSSPPITTCCRRISRSSAFPKSSSAPRARRAATAQVAGGVPAMCDGVTQGEAGMELSLFSRDVIALSTAVALSHQMFDAAVYLGVCDKIVPGLLIGALSFGHLPAVFLPAGPMTSGLSNDEKSKIRQLYAEGKVDARRAAGGRGAGLSRAGHLHVLRHRQHQSDADGDHGPASAGRLLRQSQHAAARRADRARRASARWS